MSRGKNCLPIVSRQFLTRNYPRPNCLLKCLPNCLSPTREGFLSSFKINPAVRVIARQVRGKNCLATIFAPRHQSASSGPLGERQISPGSLAEGCAPRMVTLRNFKKGYILVSEVIFSLVRLFLKNSLKDSLGKRSIYVARRILQCV